MIYLLYKVLRDLPVWYRLYTNSVIALFESEFGESYKSVQELYDNAFPCRLFDIAYWTSVSGIGVVHLLYKVLQDLPVWYRLYTHSLSALFLSDFGEPYKSVQEVYEHAFLYRLFAIVW